MIRVAVCGSPKWKKKDIIMSVLQEINPEVVIGGGNVGADKLAHQCAKELQVPTQTYIAEWETYHSKAGKQRNEKLIQEGRPTILVVFCSNVKKYLGVNDLVQRAKRYYIPIQYYNYKGEEYEA